METDIITARSGYCYFSEKTEIELYSIFKSLHCYGCTYLYYLATSPSNEKYRFSTDPDWLTLYAEESLASTDPLKRISEQPLSRFLSWQECDLLDKNEKRVMEARAAHDCLDGFNVILTKNGMQKILVLATDIPSHSIKHEILKDPHTLQNALSRLDRIDIYTAAHN